MRRYWIKPLASAGAIRRGPRRRHSFNHLSIFDFPGDIQRVILVGDLLDLFPAL
jgi:hypothetical protein